MSSAADRRLLMILQVRLPRSWNQVTPLDEARQTTPERVQKIEAQLQTIKKRVQTSEVGVQTIKEPVQTKESAWLA